jgi:hypothetical protein
MKRRATPPGRLALGILLSLATVSSAAQRPARDEWWCNRRPVANAGPDQTVSAGTTVTLDGSGSSDPDGHSLCYRWSLVSRPAGSQARLSDRNAVRPTFVADLDGAYVIHLVVTDRWWWPSLPDEVRIVTAPGNSPPVAGAGPDQSVLTGATVQLDGSTSSDADGDPLTYAWQVLSRPEGSQAVLSDPTQVTPTFLADLEGEYVVQLTVGDGQAASSPDTVTIHTEQGNAPPVADAGDDQSVTAGDTVLLDGSGSSDPDGDPLTYRWSLLAVPAGSQAALQDGQSVQPRLVADLPGQYVVQLIVNDGQLDSVPSTLLVTAGPGNSPPTADAGPDQAVVAGDGVTLDGGLSADPDGDPLTFQWAVLSRPAGSAAALSDPTAQAPTFTADLPGTYVVQLIVSDGSLQSAPDTVLVTAEGVVVTLSTTDADASERGPDPGTFRVARTGSAALPLTVLYTTFGTAINGTDYTLIGSSVTIPAGAAGADVVVDPIDDGVFELPETVILRLSESPDYVVGTTSPAVVTMADDDTLVSVVAGDASAGEAGPDPGSFTVHRVGDTSGDLAVVYAVGGTATPGADYQALPGTVTLPAGSSTAVVTVTPTDDTLIEGPESVVLTLGPGPAYTVGAPAAATVTIDDDERPVVTITVSDDASEAGPDPGTFTVARTGPATSALTVTYGVLGSATNGTDYQAIPTSLTIPAGSSTATVTITPIDDAAVEGAESVLLGLLPGTAYVVGLPGLANMTIADNDISVVTVEATDPDATEAGPTTGTFVFSRTGSTSGPLLIAFTASGTATNPLFPADYVDFSTLITIPAGQASVALTLTPLLDNLLEGPETVTLTINPSLQYVVGSPNAATVTIADDPAVVNVEATDAEAAEAGPDTGTLLFTRSGGKLSVPLSISLAPGGTAASSIDYVALGSSVTIPANETSATVTLVPRADNAVEGTETAVATINAGTTYAIGPSGSATISLLDDPAVLTVLATDPDAAEAGLDPGSFTFIRSGGNLAAQLQVIVQRGGTASSGGDYVSIGGSAFIVTFPAGQTSATVEVVPRADNLVESPETVVVTIQPGGSHVIGTPGSATVTIADDPAVVTVTASDPDASEAGPDPGVFTFTRAGGNLAAALTVSFARGGTAANTADYANIGFSVVIPAGSAEATVTITPVDDALVEGPETAVLTVNGSTSYVVGVPGSATVTIADND